MKVTRNSVAKVAGGALASALLASALVMPSSAQEIGVSSTRLLNADNEPANWLMVHQNYAGHNFSGLTQINQSTVSNLALAFSVLWRFLGRLRPKPPPSDSGVS